MPDVHATVVPVRQTWRAVRLIDATWQIDQLPQRVEPVFEVIRTRGYRYPTVLDVVCPNGHHHSVGQDRHGYPALPDTVERRFHNPDGWCESCRDVHEDFNSQYHACTICGADVGDIPSADTGEFTFSVQIGERLVPETYTLILLDGPATLRVPLSWHDRFPLTDVDGQQVCDVAIEEMRGEPGGYPEITADDRTRLLQTQDRLLLDVRPIGAPQDVARALHAAVTGEVPAGLGV